MIHHVGLRDPKHMKELFLAEQVVCSVQPRRVELYVKWLAIPSNQKREEEGEQGC